MPNVAFRAGGRTMPRDMSNKFKDAKAEAKKRGIGSYERHFLICIGPDCVSESGGQAAWNRLKKRSAEVNGSSDFGALYRSKVGCLRVCEDGPVGVVYPDGTWYAGLTPDVVDRVIDEHIKGGKPVESHVIGSNPLPYPKAGK